MNSRFELCTRRLLYEDDVILSAKIQIHVFMLHDVHSFPLICNRTHMWCPIVANTPGLRRLRRSTLLHGYVEQTPRYEND